MVIILKHIKQGGSVQWDSPHWVNCTWGSSHATATYFVSSWEFCPSFQRTVSISAHHAGGSCICFTHQSTHLEYWHVDQETLCHCCNWGEGLPMGPDWVCWWPQPQSLGLSSCSGMGRPIDPLASMFSFSGPVCILGLLSPQELSQAATQVRRLA